MTSKIAKVLFTLALCSVLLFASATSLTALECPRCFTGPEQVTSANHAEPNCAWAQMHACTKARWNISCGDWIETNVSISPCTYSGGLNHATCTITYKCVTCTDELCGPLVP
ncbi:MAG TPA: hypothetical protein VLV83_21245 [Acidobacteriota bacterium]|nr:hypothetical protein [Acidobacteriota bacterium]